MISKLVCWCFKPSQAQRITPGLKETFIKRNVAERTSRAEIRQEETERESGELSGEFKE